MKFESLDTYAHVHDPWLSKVKSVMLLPHNSVFPLEILIIMCSATVLPVLMDAFADPCISYSFTPLTSFAILHY